jgi:hypothetical protein
MHRCKGRTRRVVRRISSNRLALGRGWRWEGSPSAFSWPSSIDMSSLRLRVLSVLVKPGVHTVSVRMFTSL